MRKYYISVAVFSFILFFLFSSGVSAEMKPGAVSVSPFIGGYVFEGNQDFDNAMTYGLGIGYNLTKEWGIEAVLNHVDSGYDYFGKRDLNAYMYRLDGLYHFNITDRFVPYIAAGVGGIDVNPGYLASDHDAMVNYGGGIKYFLTENLALRGDVRHVVSFDSTHHNLLYTAGLTFLFGGDTKAAAAPPAPVMAPAPKPEPKPVPKSVPIVVPPPKPQPKDTDGDGVYDDMDQCPDTPKLAQVDKRGCWVLRGVMFDFGKSDIKTEGIPVLSEVAVVLKNNPSMRVSIEGHTDDVSSEAWNQKLSERRAQAVMKYLVLAGIEPSRIKAKGFGESVPAATNDTEEGRAVNRRVEIKPVK